MKVIQSTFLLDEKERHMEKLVDLKNAAVMNIQLKTGEAVPEHDNKREVIIAVRRGTVQFELGGEEILVTQENLLHMSPMEKHSLVAIEDSDILVIQIEP